MATKHRTTRRAHKRTNRRARRLGPRYKVDVLLQAWDIPRAGAAIMLLVREHDELLGTIEIGQGTFGWKSARRKKGFKRIQWRRLAEKLDEVG